MGRTRESINMQLHSTMPLLCVVHSHHRSHSTTVLAQYYCSDTVLRFAPWGGHVTQSHRTAIHNDTVVGCESSTCYCWVHACSRLLEVIHGCVYNALGLFTHTCSHTHPYVPDMRARWFRNSSPKHELHSWAQSSCVRDCSVYADVCSPIHDLVPLSPPLLLALQFVRGSSGGVLDGCYLKPNHGIHPQIRHRPPPLLPLRRALRAALPVRPRLSPRRPPQRNAGAFLPLALKNKSLAHRPNA